MTRVTATYEEPRRPSNPILAGYHQEYDAIAADVQSLAAGLTGAQFNWRTQPGTWSIAECLGHLTVFGATCLEPLDRQIAEVKSRGLRADGPFYETWLGNWFIGVVEPPYRLRAKTFRNLIPPPEQQLADALPAFLHLQEQVQERVLAADGFDVGAVTARIPSKLSLTLGQWYRFIAAHERRHLWQAWNVRNHPAFPR